MNNFRNFPSCHVHIQSLDSASTPERFAKRELELGTGYVTVTDHGTLEATREVYDLCHKGKYAGKLSPILGCLMPGQEIHTLDGVKNVEDIVVGDLVLTHQGRFRRVVNTFTRPYEGDVYTFYRSLPGGGDRGLTVTEEHPIFIAGPSYDRTPKFIEAKDVKVGRQDKYYGKKYHLSSVLLPRLEKGAVRSIDCSAERQLPCKGKRLRKKIKITRDLAYFLGLYVAEGSAEDSGQFSLCFHENEKSYQDFCVKYLYSAFDITAKVYVRPEKGIAEVVACHKQLAALLLRLCGKGSKNKRVPTEIMQASSGGVRRAFLFGLLDGDGHKGKDNTLKTSSKNLAWQARLLAVGALGVFPSAPVYLKTQEGFESWSLILSREAKWRRSFWVAEQNQNQTVPNGGRGKWQASPLARVEKTHYKGPVFNFEVEEDNSYVSDFSLHNCEGYFRDDLDPILEKNGIGKVDGSYKKTFKYAHITLHALDEPAYSALSRALSRADLRAEKHGSEYKPLFDWKALEELGQYNITATSGCLIGMVGRHLLANNDPYSAIAYYEKLRSIVKPGNFYVEIFPHVCDRNWESKVVVTDATGKKHDFYPYKKLRFDNIELKAEELVGNISKLKGQSLRAVMNQRSWTEVEPFQLQSVEAVEGFVQNECRPWAPDGDVQLGVNKFLLKLATKYKDPILVSDDCHFAYPEEHIIQDIRLAQHGGSWKFANSHHRMPSEEAWQYFKEVMGVSASMFEGWVQNSYDWAGRFKDFRFSPKTTLPVSFYPRDTLAHTMKLIESHGRMKWDNPTWVARLEQEINLLHRNGTIDLLPYFFIDEEVVRQYAKNVLLCGPGRGSAAGLLLSYLLGITHVDPIKYNLSVDRFLTLDRIQTGKLPDIDQDLENREFLMGPEGKEGTGWIYQRFGNHVAQISTNTTIKLKSAILDTFRARRGKVPEEVAAFSKSLPPPPQGIPDTDYVFGYTDTDGTWQPGLYETHAGLQEFSKTYPEEWEVIKRLIGINRQRSRHACHPAGVIISVIDPTTGLSTKKEIQECNGEIVETGQGNRAIALLLPQGLQEVWEFELENGQKIRATPDHKFLTKNQGWKTAKEILDLQLELILNAENFPLNG